MIQANELMLGNFVDTPDGTVKITAISYEKVAVIRKTEEGNFAVYSESLDDIQPIPLTEDILIKCGFTKVPLDSSNPEEGHYYSLRLLDEKYCDLSLLSGDKNGIFEVYLFPYENIRFQYLHQVQNLYYALTVTELKINL